VGREATPDVLHLFDALARRLREAGDRFIVGAESPRAPYLRIVSLPERRSLQGLVTPERRTSVRLVPFDEYLRYLESSFPRLYDELARACVPGRPFLVIEGWIRYVALGTRLAAFAREHALNVRCVDFAGNESRLNGLRIHFDLARHQWRISAGSVEDVLRDPRREPRSLADAWNPRWPASRVAGRVADAARRAAALLLS
jgi:hypothetical protein